MTIQQGDTKITELPTLPKTGGYDYEYDLRDHLGNTRVTCKGVFDANGNITSTVVMQKNSYYPAVYPEEIGGLLHGGKNTIATNKYLYNGKELQTDYNFDLYDYGARFYDPQLGRFTGIDPIAEKYAFVTPYNYAENSPIANIDLWGLQSYYTADGSLLRVNDPKVDKAYLITYNTKRCEDPTRVLYGMNILVEVETPIPISNSELNERALWVYSESGGSSEIITDVKNNVGDAGNEVIGMRVVDIYANAINNGVNDNKGDWNKLTDKRMSKEVDGKLVSTKADFFAGKAPAGTPHGRALTNEYNKNKNPAVFDNHLNANNARSAVIKSLTNPVKMGGAGHWLGSGDAKKYVDDEDRSTSRTKTAQFSFKSAAGYHTIYKWD